MNFFIILYFIFEDMYFAIANTIFGAPESHQRHRADWWTQDMAQNNSETLTSLVERVVPEGAQFTPEKFQELEDALQGAVARSCDAAGLEPALRDQRIASLKALLETKRPVTDIDAECETTASNTTADFLFAPEIHRGGQPVQAPTHDAPPLTVDTTAYRNPSEISGGGKGKTGIWLTLGALAIGLAGAGGYFYYDELSANITPAPAQQQVAQVSTAPPNKTANAETPSTPVLTTNERAVLQKRFATIATIQNTLKTHAERVKRYPATGGNFVAAPRLLKTLQTQGTALPELDLKVAQDLRYKSDGKSFKLTYLATGDCHQVMKVAPDRVDPKRRFGGDCYSYGRWTPGGKNF
ncbi:hypothetical protein [Ahrensia sp. R2A130]|uniref:hypothetical protein n=1 Tax=Ahrensia sp. R2A130 TaxID=744979 RepID=UPI0001E0F85E|nr:hypothetical protein [Ahrensia sp. R2A130]EFL89469.1 60S acidic ribosomal protein P2 [Ahrensia sp. R2A130]